jgi:hypothetical protein
VEYAYRQVAKVVVNTSFGGDSGGEDPKFFQNLLSTIYNDRLTQKKLREMARKRKNRGLKQGFLHFEATGCVGQRPNDPSTRMSCNTEGYSYYPILSTNRLGQSF